MQLTQSLRIEVDMIVIDGQARSTEHGRMRYLSILILLIQFQIQCAQLAQTVQPVERGVDLIRTELQVARSGLRALSVAAHPDDEDGATLSYLRRTLGFETHICLATRGEGGQNEIGPEIGAALAELRTRETEAACSILGAKAWYLNLPDFGYSKSVEETLKMWDHSRALANLVRVIRIVRPHVIFTNHDPDGTDHGHHRATGKILLEAFEAAADASKFSEQMKEDGTAPWTVSKLYVRKFAPPGSMLSVTVSERDALSGLSASEIGAMALALHSSQGMQRNLKLGEKEMRWFTLLKTRVKTSGEKPINYALPSQPPKLLEKIDAALGALSAATLQDGSACSFIADAIKEAAQSKNDCRAHLERALIEALGIKAELSTDDELSTFDEPVKVALRVVNTGSQAVQFKNWALVPESAAWKVNVAGAERVLAAGDNIELDGSATAAKEAFLTWPQQIHAITRVEMRKPVNAKITLEFGGVEFTLMRPVPLDLAAPHETSIVPDPVLLFDTPERLDDEALKIKFRISVVNRRRITEPLKLFAGIQGAMPGTPVDRFVTMEFHGEDEVLSDEFRALIAPAKLNKGEVLVPTAVWTADTNFGGPQARIRRVTMKLPPVLHVAIVRTYDDTTFNALEDMANAGTGLNVTSLTADDLRNGDLNRFHTIILDLRATQFRPEVRQVKERLKQFMNDGGNVVCMYHKDFDWNKADSDDLRGKGFFRGRSGGGEIAPYPIELSFARVTNEDAPVRILQPMHPLLCEPCKIWAPDFQGWVQERGAYFPKKWAPQYTALLSCNDEGEPALDGGLLVADVGAGSFIYTSYMWYRQLRAGVPGAYRLLANMISYPRVKRKK